MPSDWREIFDRTFQKRVRDEVWKLLPSSLVCRVTFVDSELDIEIERPPNVIPYWADADPLAPTRRKIRGFRFVLPPIHAHEAQAWLDGCESRIGSIVGSIREHLPAIIEELTGDAPSRVDA